MQQSRRRKCVVTRLHVSALSHLSSLISLDADSSGAITTNVRTTTSASLYNTSTLHCLSRLSKWPSSTELIFPTRSKTSTTPLDTLRVATLFQN